MSEALSLLRRMAAAPPAKRSYFTGTEASELLRIIEKPAAQQFTREELDMIRTEFYASLANGAEHPLFQQVYDKVHAIICGLPVETSVATTDHAANLAIAVEAYIVAATRISAGGVEASEWDSASDTWRAVKTAAHEYRKHFPLKSAGGSRG
jgi:hypothetical protein